MLALNLDMDTWAHRVKASYKLSALAVVSIATFWVSDISYFGVGLVAICLLYSSLGKGSFSLGYKMLRPIFWMALLILAYHVIVGEYYKGVLICLRIIFMLSLANFVTMTTRLDDMMAIVERIAGWFKFMGVNPKIVAMSCAMVIRFTPVLALKGGYLIDSWRSRSLKRPNWRLLIPFCLMALDDADHLAEAIKARGGIKSS